MNYDGVIIELLSRVQELEKQVKIIIEKDDTGESSERVSTSDIFDYIMLLKREAKQRGETKLVLRAGDIEKSVGLKNRTTMVVNAMKKAMTAGDAVLSSTPSGFSTTFKVEYLLRQ